MAAEHDPRTTPARPDLAAAHLEGRVRADRYVAGRQACVTAPVLDMRGAPDPAAALGTQLFHGEGVTVYEDDPGTGHAWVQNRTDGYVGYVPAAGLGPCLAGTPRRVRTRTAQVYPMPALKTPPALTLPYLALVTVTDTRDGYAALAEGGFVPAPQLAPAGTVEADFVAVAERFLGAPYLWGGRSVLGLDCSALVQLALMAAGRDCPRDSDMQAALGTEATGAARRGDLVFWTGHVGILTGAAEMIHANAHHMEVVREPLDTATARIAASEGPVTARRRLAVSP